MSAPHEEHVVTTTLSLATILREAALRHPDAVALVEGERQVTYRDLWADCLRWAAALRERGLEDGGRVALLAPNVVDFVRGYYGILAAGGTVVPVPTLLGAREAAYLVQHSGAMGVLAHAAFAEVGAGAADACGVPCWDLGTLGQELGEGAEPLRTLRSREPMDAACVFYTSGTTGRPKGAVLTHLNLVMTATVGAFDGTARGESDTVLGCLPLFHIYGQSSLLNTTFRSGGTVVLQPRFDAAEALELMVRHDVTVFAGVPTMFVQLLEAQRRRPAGAPLPPLRYCGSGGASLPVSVLERFQEEFDTVVYEGYGLSETSPTATTNQERYGTRAGTVGHPVWGIDVDVVDAERQDEIVPLPDGELGEIVVRGHNVFAGYLDDPAATRTAVVDGWFRTGDLGRRDEEGFVSIVDRVKDMVIRGGFNVYPREVEELLLGHPDVAQVAVIGVPDETYGEEVCAVVVPEAGASPDPAALVAWARERLGGHKYPRRVEVVESLPLGPSMKVLKRELRTRFS